MSDWKTDPPTIEELPDGDPGWMARKDGTVEWYSGRALRLWFLSTGDLHQGIAWCLHATRPDPYVPPEPKRREFAASNGNFKSPTKYREVFPDDPDIDKLIAERDDWKKACIAADLDRCELKTTMAEVQEDGGYMGMGPKYWMSLLTAVDILLSRTPKSKSPSVDYFVPYMAMERLREARMSDAIVAVLDKRIKRS